VDQDIWINFQNRTSWTERLQIRMLSEYSVAGKPVAFVCHVIITILRVKLNIVF